MAVLEDRPREARGDAGGSARRAIPGIARAERSFHDLPAVVRSRARAGGLEVDLLARPLPDVGDEEVFGRAVEREPPRVAQADRPGLVRAARRDERIAGRDAVVRRVDDARVDVDAKDLPEESWRPVCGSRRCAWQSGSLAEPPSPIPM